MNKKGEEREERHTATQRKEEGAKGKKQVNKRMGKNKKEGKGNTAIAVTKMKHEKDERQKVC